MNNKELAKQLFETKFIKALYKTSLNKSLINKIIVEELLNETTHTSPVESLYSNLMNNSIDTLEKFFNLADMYFSKFKDANNKTKKQYSDFINFKNEVTDLSKTNGINLQDVKKGLQLGFNDNQLEELGQKIAKLLSDAQTATRREGGPSSASTAKKEAVVAKAQEIEEPDKKLEAIAKIFIAFNKQETSSKEKLVDFLMLSQALGEAREKYRTYLVNGREGYSQEEKNDLDSLAEKFFELFNELGLQNDLQSDRNTILQKLEAQEISEEALSEAIKGIKIRFKPIVDAVVRKTKGTEKKDFRDVAIDFTKILKAYKGRVESWIKFVDGIKSKAEEKFKDDIDKRQILVGFIQEISEDKNEFVKLKMKIEEAIVELDEIRRNRRQSLSEAYLDSLFDPQTRVRITEFEELNELLNNILGRYAENPEESIESLMASLQNKFNNIKEKANNPETYKISKDYHEKIGNHSVYPPVPKATKDDFLDTIAVLAMYPPADDAGSPPFPSLIDILDAIDPGFLSKMSTKITSTLRESLEQSRHGFENLNLEDEAQLKKAVEEVVKTLEPYKEELVLAMIESSFAIAKNEESNVKWNLDDHKQDFENYLPDADLSEIIAYMKVTGKFDNLKSKNLKKQLKDFKGYRIFYYIALMLQSEGKTSGIQFDILNKVKKRKINFEVLKKLVNVFKNERSSVLKSPYLSDFGRSLVKYSVNKSMGKSSDFEKSLEETLRPIIEALINHKEP